MPPSLASRRRARDGDGVAVADSSSGKPRPKVPRRELDRDQMASLRIDAQATLDKLTSPKACASPAPAPPPAKAGGAGTLCRTADALTETLRGYVRRCQITGCVPLLDDVHNIVLNRQHEANATHRRAVAHEGAMCRSVDYVRLRELAAALVVCLWQCALRTPHARHLSAAREL